MTRSSCRFSLNAMPATECARLWWLFVGGALLSIWILDLNSSAIPARVYYETAAVEQGSLALSLVVATCLSDYLSTCTWVVGRCRRWREYLRKLELLEDQGAVVGFIPAVLS